MHDHKRLQLQWMNNQVLQIPAKIFFYTINKHNFFFFYGNQAFPIFYSVSGLGTNTHLSILLIASPLYMYLI